MNCPKCGANQLKCIDSRPTDDSVRRRKMCLVCEHRFTTMEVCVRDYKSTKTREVLLANQFAAISDLADQIKGVCDSG